MACGLSELLHLFKIDHPAPARNEKSSPHTTVMYTGGTIRPLVGGNIDQVEAIGFYNERVYAVGSQEHVQTKMDGLQVI